MIADQVPGLIPLPQGCFALRRITLMPQTNRQILRFYFSRVSKMARLASRQEMLRPMDVVGSSMVTAIRGFSVLSGRAEAATSVLQVRRNSRRCTRALYTGGRI